MPMCIRSIILCVLNSLIDVIEISIFLSDLNLIVSLKNHHLIIFKIYTYSFIYIYNQRGLFKL